MKVGILTFHRTLNYGAILQCYALFQTLCNMGYDVEVIDYRPAYLEKYRIFFYWRDFRKMRFPQKLKMLIFLPLSYLNKKKTTAVFDSFIGNNIKLSAYVKGTDDIPKYDAIIFGSDQIWNPRICEGFDPLFWGQFPKGKTKFISYAASLGTPQVITKHQWEIINEYIKSFDSISVRESKSKEYLMVKGMSINTVLDPTLLANEDIFERISAKPNETKYILLYMLEYDRKAISFANRIAKEKGLKLIRLQAISSPSLTRREYTEVVPKSVGEFVGYFKHADYIVNVSFHGTAFSIIYRKDFYTMRSKNFERAYGLLNSLGLLSRFVSSEENVQISDIDYSHINILLERMRDNSKCFITESLKNKLHQL